MPEFTSHLPKRQRKGVTMRAFVLVLALGISVSLLAGCAPPAEQEGVSERDTSQENLDAINAIVGSFVTAYNSADATALAQLFAEDGIRMPPEATSYAGRVRIESEFEAEFEQGTGTIVVNLQETVMGDDLAFTRGTWAITTQPEEGEATSVVGKWINLVTRQDDGSWKISRNIWNFDSPNG